MVAPPERGRNDGTSAPYLPRMLRPERLGPVTRLRMSSARSRLVGYEVSAYVVDGVLVDTGFPGIRAELARWLDANPLRGAMVTHQHEDHAGNVHLLAARGVPLAIPAATLAVLRAAPRIALYRAAVWRRLPPFRRDFVPFEDERLRLEPLPGHSPDHHGVWDAERGFLFGGDLFLGVRVRVAHAEEDPRLLLASVRRAIALNPARLFDAHRGEVRDPVRALGAKAEWLEETIGEVERRALQGWSVAAIQRAVLGREEWIGHVSFGEYSRRNLVRGILERTPSATTVGR